MGKVLLEEQSLIDIANSIRSKTGSEETMTPGEMSENIEKIEGVSDYFTDTVKSGNSTCGGWVLEVKKLPAFKNSGTSCSNMFTRYEGEYIDLSKFDTSNVTYMNSMFQYCYKLQELDVSNFNTEKVINMSSMFSLRGNTGGAGEIKKLILGSNFNTSSVTNMSNMFTGCAGLTNLDVSTFNTEKVTNMSSMFDGCSGLTNINLSNFNTSAVTNMSEMFDGCNGLTSIDLSNFNTSLVTNMSSMFQYCKNLTSIDIRNFDFTNVTSYSSMFGSSASNGVPNDCLIIVKDDVAKTWITSKFSRLTNVKTIAEYESEV